MFMLSLLHQNSTARRVRVVTDVVRLRLSNQLFQARKIHSRGCIQLEPDTKLVTLKTGGLEGISIELLQNLIDNKHVVVYPEVVSQKEHDSIVDEIDVSGTDVGLKRFRERTYETAHWDQVITGYKELERPIQSWNCNNAATLTRIQNLISSICAQILEVDLHKLPDGENVAWLPPHIIDLSADGIIYPHVDSIKHSDQIVAGLSLLSSRVMKLREPKDDISDYSQEDGGVDIVLPPRSLYILSKDARFKMAHSVAKEESSDRRLSIIFRDDLPPPWLRKSSS